MDAMAIWPSGPMPERYFAISMVSPNKDLLLDTGIPAFRPILRSMSSPATCSPFWRARAHLTAWVTETKEAMKPSPPPIPLPGLRIPVRPTAPFHGTWPSILRPCPLPNAFFSNRESLVPETSMIRNAGSLKIFRSGSMP